MEALLQQEKRVMGRRGELACVSIEKQEWRREEKQQIKTKNPHNSVKSQLAASQ